MNTHASPPDEREDGCGFTRGADKAGGRPGGGGPLPSRWEQCDIDGDGQSGRKMMNSPEEAIGAGVGPAQQPASQEAGTPGRPRNSHSGGPGAKAGPPESPTRRAPRRCDDASRGRLALE